MINKTKISTIMQLTIAIERNSYQIYDNDRRVEDEELMNGGGVDEIEVVRA